TVFGISKLPAIGILSFADLKAAVKPDQLSMAHSLRDANGNFNEYSWLTVMIGYHVLGIWYWCTDQTIVQKTLGAKDMRNGQLGAVFAGVLKILPLFFMVFPGVLAYLLFKNEIGNNPNDALTIMIDKLLPVGLKGLFAAGLLAAVMSTVEAALNSTATVTAKDIVQKIWPKIQDRTLVLIGRITAAVVIVLAMIWSPYCGRFRNIFVVINKVPMMFAPAITTVFVLGVFWKRGTKQAALATFIVGLVVGLPYFLLDLPRDVPVTQVQAAIDAGRVAPAKIVEGVVTNYETVTHGIGIPYMMMGLILLCMCIAVYVVTTLLTPAPTAEDLERIGWRPPLRVLVETKITGIADPRIVAIGLFVLMAVLYYFMR
ncbi:MAG: sodium:solute symporter family transporter, partial [Planctomycetota bacterium]